MLCIHTVRELCKWWQLVMAVSYLSVSPSSTWTPYGQGSSLVILEGPPCLLPSLDCTDLLQIQGNLRAEQTRQLQSPDGWSPFPASVFPSHTHSRVQTRGSGALRGNGDWNLVGGSVLSMKQGLCLSLTRGMILQPKTKWSAAWSGGKDTSEDMGWEKKRKIPGYKCVCQLSLHHWQQPVPSPKPSLYTTVWTHLEVCQFLFMYSQKLDSTL